MPIAFPLVPVGVFVAIALLLVAWAAVVLLAEPLKQLLGELPLVGGAIARVVSGAVSRVVSWATNWADNAIGELVAAVWVPIRAVVGYVGAVTDFAEATAAKVAQVVTSWGGAIARHDTLIGLLQGAIGTLTRAISDAWSRLALHDRIIGLLQGAIGTLTGLVTAIQGRLALHDRIIGLAQGAIDTLTRVLSRVESTLGDLAERITAGDRAVAQAAAAAAAAAEAHAMTAVTTLEHTLEGTIDDVRARLEALVQALAPTLALELPLVIPALLEEVATMEAECVRPICGVLGPMLDELRDLQGGAMVAAMLAFVAAAVADPADVANATASTIDGVRQVADPILSMAGIHV